MSWGLTAAECAADLFAPTKLVKLFAKAGSIGGGAIQAAGDCLVMPSDSSMQQRAVTSIDPNDIRGPVGVGEPRFIPGDGPLSYEVLFENLPAATAPAQRVEIHNQLDTTRVDPATVLFEDIRFGTTIFTLPYASPQIDEMIDLRPAQNLLVRVTADTSAGGMVQWVLQAIDPETLAPPENPLVGLLPPNDASHRGEGLVSYSVAPRTLDSGAVITNKASIVFDSNPAIETPTWSNTIDKQSPVPTVTADAAAVATNHCVPF